MFLFVSVTKDKVVLFLSMIIEWSCLMVIFCEIVFNRTPAVRARSTARYQKLLFPSQPSDLLQTGSHLSTCTLPSLGALLTILVTPFLSLLCWIPYSMSLFYFSLTYSLFVGRGYHPPFPEKRWMETNFLRPVCQKMQSEHLAYREIFYPHFSLTDN